MSVRDGRNIMRLGLADYEPLNPRMSAFAANVRGPLHYKKTTKNTAIEADRLIDSTQGGEARDTVLKPGSTTTTPSLGGGGGGGGGGRDLAHQRPGNPAPPPRGRRPEMDPVSVLMTDSSWGVE